MQNTPRQRQNHNQTGRSGGAQRQNPRSAGNRSGQRADLRRPPMTEEEYRAYRARQRAYAESRRREEELEKMRRKQALKKKRAHDRQIFLGRLAVFGAVFAIIVLLVCGFIWILFHHTPDAVEETKISYTYGGAQVRKADFETAYVNGVYFFCFNDLADYLGMAETGSAAERRFLFKEADTDDSGGSGNEEYVSFPTGESTALVNGQVVHLDGTTRLVGDEVWVSLDFIADVMENISLKTDKNSVAIAKIVDETNSDKNALQYLDASFRLKSNEPLETVDEGSSYLPGHISGNDREEDYTIDFVNNLSAYEEYMNPADRDSYLMLVNTTHTLNASYEPTDLMDVAATASGRSMQTMREYACKALEALLLEMASAGYTTMQVNSGFRTYNYQAILFDTYTNNEMTANPTLSREQAEQIVLTYSTRPGTSEHQTGLAVDMAIDASFSTDFQYTDEYEWLMNNAWKFGFILRFPADKTHLTTISFEPWHWRYVGRYHAKKIHDSGVCLEEYIASIEKE